MYILNAAPPFWTDVTPHPPTSSRMFHPCNSSGQHHINSERLPTELVILVYHYLDLATLSQVSRTSRRHRAIAEPLLYSGISSHPEDTQSLPVARAVGFFRSLLNPVCLEIDTPLRARHLQRLCVSLRDWAKPQFLFLRGLLQLIANALANCSNIVELHILDFQHRDAWILDHCVCRPRIFATTLPPSPTLERFLFDSANPQTKLETLVLANRFSTYWGLKFSHPSPLQAGNSWALPSLRAVFGRADILHFLIPNRPIGRAVYDFSLDAYDDPSTAYPQLREALATSAQPVKRLGIQIRAGPRDNVIWGDCPLFSDVRGSPLTSVVTLDLYIPTFYYFKAFEELKRFLAPFPQLETFKIFAGHIFKVHTDTSLLEAASSWSKSCKHLRVADFHQFESWSLRNDTPSRTLRCSLTARGHWASYELEANSDKDDPDDLDYSRLAELLRLTLRG